MIIKRMTLMRSTKKGAGGEREKKIGKISILGAWG